MAPRGTCRQIADELRQRIAKGDMQPDTMARSRNAFVERHGIARGTVRSALTLLEDEGLIETMSGQGRRYA